ncbi:Nem1-Spo7 phosphatase regulatory subunit SPO7 ASCRUDRAFT_30597, partial [Ascoidea rubescens DSM 1968]
KIFRNLLILEQSFITQYNTQKSLKRKYTSFYFTMIISSLLIFYKLFLSISPLSSNFSKILLKFLMFFQLVTIFLFHISGEYNRTIIIPKKFLFHSNKSLRAVNLRIIKIPFKFTDNLISFLTNFLIKFTSIFLIFLIKNLFFFNRLKKILILNFNLFYLKNILIFLNKIKLNCQLRSTYIDIEIKLILNPRNFNTDLREEYDFFRDEYISRQIKKEKKKIGQLTIDDISLL